MPTQRRARQLKQQVTRFGARAALIVLALVLAAGCGGGNDDAPEPLAAPGLAIDGSRVSIWCFGADCSAYITADGDAVHVSVNRAVEGTAVGRSEVLSSTGTTDIEIEFGNGNDRIVIQNYVLSGTLRVAMGDGDDDVRMVDDAGSLGRMDLDLGPGNDRAEFDPRLLSRGFRIDAGPDDDEVVIRAACFPYGSIVRGGTGTDFLFATAKLVAQAATLDGFEERTLGSGGFNESCRDLE